MAAGSFLSDSVQVVHLVVAGPMQSASWSRIYARDMSDNIHRPHPPLRNSIGGWAGDLAQLNLSAAAGVVGHLAEYLKLTAFLRSKGFCMSK
eukprot:2855987-Pyramimonas_sp.AAC.1